MDIPVGPGKPKLAVVKPIKGAKVYRPDFPEREEPSRHWIVYTNAGYFLVYTTETKVWEKQQEYIKTHRLKGARLDQIVFNYQPVTVELINAIK